MAALYTAHDRPGVPVLANHDASLVGRDPDVRVLVESTRLRLLEYGRLTALSGDKKPDSIDLRAFS